MLENEVFNRPYVRDITKTCECTCSVTCNPDIITNAGRIRAMSDEELAEWLACPICKYASCKKTCPVILPSADPCEMQILGWLQQPAEEEP